MTTTNKTPSKSSSKDAPDAVDLLAADHKNVKAMFKQFSKLKDEGSDEEKAALVAQICDELKVHATVEEELFYPAVREATGDDDLVDEATVEHAGAKDLIGQLEASGPGEDLYDAKVTVLGEQIEHHVKEEEDEMFPKARKMKIDLVALGSEMKARKEELIAELGMSEDANPTPTARKKASNGQSRSDTGRKSS